MRTSVCHHFLLCSVAVRECKFDETRALIARGANINCLDEFSTSALGYLTIEDLHGDIVEFLEGIGGEVVKFLGIDFYFDLYCCDD